ncbi:uncharacterized protein N7479_005962 [Penicillium vulpinum]|uniref:Uncharacterized protein n=1 Tax=Penicillium vulpinum TaxID=29845 RepID=A0A1V6SEE2_9EURO|nr:uncharacterized protein N7479_005962 [Penicillium vulpinum]KAJ5958812.1 hypothetical protein N7479_005962 [Penicillium vulpinum]OQE12361.1 hypothetical protein PENVUL_c001G02502 [Penicillium vulpinum]
MATGMMKESPKFRDEYARVPAASYHGSETPVDDEDTASVGLLGHIHPRLRHSRSRWVIFFSSTSLVLVLALLATSVYIATSVRTMGKVMYLHPDGRELGDCGPNHTVEEAREYGCVFDPMSWLWVRPECYDKVLIDDFMNRTEWSWHTDWKLTPETKVPLDVVFSGEHPQLYTSKKYHSIHCTYMWQKMHKALLEHGPVDSDLTNWHHTHHCEQVLLDQYLHEDSECTADMICPTLVRATWTACGYF